MKYLLITVTIALSGFLLFESCKFDPTESFSWDADLLTPIATSSVTIGDAITDSTLISEDSTGFLSIVFRDTLLRAELEEFLRIPDTSVIQNFDLSTFELAPQAITQRITLADLARSLIADGNSLGTLILLNQGATLPFVPDQNGFSSGAIQIDASELFEIAVLDSGEMELTILNQLPLGIRNIDYTLENTTLQTPIATGNFPLILAGDSAQEVFDLGGQTIESSITAELTNLDIIGGASIPIDTNDYIEVRLTVSKLRAQEATAIFPTQTVQQDTTPLVYAFSGDLADLELTNILLETGSIDATLFSTIEDTIAFTYSLPSTTLNGDIPSISAKLNPAPPGGLSTFNQLEDLSGYLMDLTFDGTRTNSLAQSYTIDLIFSGKQVSIDQQDSVFLSYTLQNVTPSYVEGYFGTGTDQYSGTVDIDAFQDLSIGSLDLERPSAELIIQNGLGMELEVRIVSLEAVKSQEGFRLGLTGAPLNSPVFLDRLVLPDTFGITEERVSFTTANSNLKQVISAVPDQLAYNVDVIYNQNAVPAELDNFATNESEVRAIFELDLPLEGQVASLILTDTSEVDFGSTDAGRIQSGSLRLLFENQFPLEAVVEATIYDENFTPLGVLLQGQTISPGVPTANGRVETLAQSTLERTFSQEELNLWIEQGAFIIFRYIMDTRPSGTPVQLYADYTLNGRLVGNFDYRFNN
ncbi:MAG: hypothetical protein AAF655_03875 [Bacteroidota bacterium]